MTQDSQLEAASVVTRPGEAEIADAKRYLNLCRELGDPLKTDLAESVLNDLLDRYHTYHASQRSDNAE